MDVNTRINAFAALGQRLTEELQKHKNNEFTAMSDAIRIAFHKNGWFDESMVVKAISGISSWLSADILRNWVAPYEFNESDAKTVGVIMAGNIPLVGFHDYLCVLISGNNLLAKVSSKDEVLIKYVHSLLCEVAPEFESKCTFTSDRMTGMDAMIATGSDNSAKYFEYYFGKLPNIIRKNRTSIAVLSGKESKEELGRLGDDIFTYYGLGCRNVTKVYVPADFSVDWLYEGLFSHGEVINHHKYQNNYDYHKSVCLLNQDQIWDNNFLLLKESTELTSPVGLLYFEKYDDIQKLEVQLNEQKDKIQCRVGVNGIPLGEAQTPTVNQYADNIDTLSFLAQL